MILENTRQLEATRGKLRLLEEHYKTVQKERAEDEHVRELTLLSLKKFINQLKEDIVRFESRMATAHRGQG